MTNDLVTPAELAQFANGILYDDFVVDAAVRAVRHYLGWHVAPRGTRTVILDGPHTKRLALPTLDPDAQVVAVRDVSGDTPVALTGWRKTANPILYREAGWPCGVAVLEVDILHGYATCPMDLRPLIATTCANLGTSTGGVLKSVRIDDFAETYDTAIAATGPTQTQPYRIPRKTTA